MGSINILGRYVKVGAAYNRSLLAPVFFPPLSESLKIFRLGGGVKPDDGLTVFHPFDNKVFISCHLCRLGRYFFGQMRRNNDNAVIVTYHDIAREHCNVPATNRHVDIDRFVQRQVRWAGGAEMVSTDIQISNCRCVAKSAVGDNALASPQPGALLTGSRVEVEVHAIDDVGVTDVVVNGYSAQARRDDPMTFRAVVDVTPGEQLLVANAFDAAGNAATRICSSRFGCPGGAVDGRRAVPTAPQRSRQ